MGPPGDAAAPVNKALDSPDPNAAGDLKTDDPPSPAERLCCRLALLSRERGVCTGKEEQSGWQRGQGPIADEDDEEEEVVLAERGLQLRIRGEGVQCLQVQCVSLHF